MNCLLNIKNNYLIIAIFFFFSFITSCNNDEENNNDLQPPAFDLSGTWEVKKILNGNCPSETYPKTEKEIMIITQSGNNLTFTSLSSADSSDGNNSDDNITEPPEPTPPSLLRNDNESGPNPIYGIISGKSITSSSSIPEGSGTSTINFSGTVSDDGKKINGTANWKWSGKKYSCSGTGEVTMTLLEASTTNYNGLWIGSYKSSVYNDLKGVFSAEITQEGMVLSGEFSLDNVTESKLKGFVTGNNMTFGDIQDAIVFTGTVEKNGNLQGSGTYTYASITDNGTWKVSKVEKGTLILESSIHKDGYPHGLAFDGENLWYSDNYDYKIYKINTSGNLLQSFDSPGYGPRGMTFDGTYLWHIDSENKLIYRIDTINGNIISSFNAPGSMHMGLTFDLNNLWLIAMGENKYEVYKLDTSGNVLDSFISPVSLPTGLAFDGTYLWLGQGAFEKKRIYGVDTAGNVIKAYDYPYESPSDMTFEGADIWIADSLDGNIYKFKIE